jgi:glycosyltransferase involved in cell wall biosynthesis
VQSVLMLCYYYPPLGGIGSQRSQKFAFYLPENGWHPIVLTPKRGSYLVDRSLDDGSTRGVEIVRTGYMDLSSMFKRPFTNGKNSNGTALAFPGPGRPVEGGAMVEFLRRAVRNWFYIPDGQIGWYPFASRAGRLAIESRAADVIYSSSFPVTAHLTAKKLKETTGKPWVADFRDLWTENHYLDYSSAFRKRIDQIIESGLLDAADVLVTVSDVWANSLRKLTGGRKRVEVIRNGFDGGEFEGIERTKPHKWTMTYVGTFYGAKQDPSAVMRVLKRLIGDGRIDRTDVCLQIVGAPDSYVEGLVRDFEISDITQFTGFIPHRESLEHQVNSSLLLIVLRESEANPGLVPGKLYEYLGSRTPVLGIMPSDYEAARIIRESDAGAIVGESDDSGIERCILDSYAAHKAGKDLSNASNDISAYDRRAGARRLAELFSDLVRAND